MISQLKKLLDSRGLTIFELNKAIGKGSGSHKINQVYNGEQSIGTLRIDTGLAVANFLGVTIEDLMEPFERDGTAVKLKTLRRQIKKIKKKCEDIKDENAGRMTYRSSANLERLEDILFTHALTGGAKGRDNSAKNTHGALQPIEETDQAQNAHGALDAVIRESAKGTGKVAEDALDTVDARDVVSGAGSGASDNATTIAAMMKMLEGADQALMNSAKSKTKQKDDADKKVKYPERAGRYHLGKQPTIIEVIEDEDGGEIRLACSFMKRNNEFLNSEYYLARFVDQPMNKEVKFYTKKTLKPIEPDNLDFENMSEISEEKFYDSLFGHYKKFGIYR